MVPTRRAARTAASAIFLLVSAAVSLALWAAGCSSRGTGSGQSQSEPRAGSQSEGLAGPVTITLSAPNPLSPIAPVMEGLNSVSLGANANVVSGTTVAMGSGGMPDIEPGALLNDVWSRGTVALRDRVSVRGVLHASSVTLGNGDTCSGGSCLSGAGRDATPRLDPPSTLSWTVTYPPGAGTNITLFQGQSQTIAPGLYGSIVLNSQSTLTLSTGTYFLTDFVVNSQVSVNLNQSHGPVIIYVTNQLNLRGAFVPTNGGADGGVVHPDLMIGYLGTNQVFVESLFDGAIVAPFATLTLRQVTGIHTGFFAAKDLNNLDSSVKVQYRAPAAVVAASHSPACSSLLAGLIPPQLIPGYCNIGCSSPDDTDHDGVLDCADSCPYDPLKTAPGICGCNVPDTDTDGDGVPDCYDKCPQDPNNTVPGQCGCVGQIGLEPAGAACSDTACPQSGATCNGAGVCGNPTACRPCTGGRLIQGFGVSYWFCGVTFPPERSPDGGLETITTGAPATESAAQSACSAKGLTLTRINTPTENELIADYLTAPLWLGANDIQTNGQWRWSVPNSNNGDLLWSGGPTGSRQNGLYTNWGGNAPGSSTCATMVPEGHWFDTNCSETHGWVCEYRSPPPGLPADAGVQLPGPSNPVPFSDAACVNPFDLDAGGLPDSLTALINQVDAGRHHTFIGVAAHPPPDGSTCPAESIDAAPSEALGLAPDSGAGCWYKNSQQVFSPDQSGDGGPGLVDCITDTDCNQLGSDFVCRTLRDDQSCVVPDAGAQNLDAGSCSGHALCVQLVCPRPTNSCREIHLCSTTPTDFDASPDPTTNLDAGTFNPASLFGGTLPDASPSGAYNDPAMFDGAAHTWCHMVPQNPVATADQPALNTGGSSGQHTTISFAFDPNLVFHVQANPLALGENQLDVHAAASLKATVSLNNFLQQNYSADIIDVGAGIHAQRCTVDNDETQFIVLGVDVIPSLGLGVPRFNSAKLFPPQTQACNDAVGNFTLWANRAKKAFRDAQQLLATYKDLQSHGAQLANTLCQDIMSTVGANDVSFFPGGLVCADGETVEETINRFVEYLQLPGFGQISQLRNAASNLVNKSTQLLDGAIPNMHVTFLDLRRDESQTILNVPFAIGPVPMVLQIDVFATYGINGRFNLELHAPLRQMAGLDDSNTQTPGPLVKPFKLAHVDVNVLPFAAAGLSAFVGAGTDLGAFSASVGIEGKVTLGQVSAPIFAGAGLDMLEQFDPRPIPSDIAGVSLAGTVGNAFGINNLFHFSKPKSFNFMVWFDYGAGIQLTNVLSGEIDAKLEIDFFFFSETWRQRIVKFNGWSKFYNLVSGGFGASTTTTQQNSLGTKNLPVSDAAVTVVTTANSGGPSMGLAEQQFPLTVLQTLDIPDGGTTGDAGDGGTFPFDASAVQSFFYDNQCCAHNQESCQPPGAGVPQCCPDYNCVAGSCQPVCVLDGGACRSGARVGCCGSQFCGPTNTCVSCIGVVGVACDPVTRPCCGNLGCSQTTMTCCIQGGNACTSPSDCCSGTCNASADGALTCGIIIP